MMATRKRMAGFLLEKPLVFRLPFEVERPPTVGAPRKRLKVDACEELDHPQDATRQMRATREGRTSEREHRNGGAEGFSAAGLDADEERGCWLGGGKTDGGGGGGACSGAGEHVVGYLETHPDNIAEATAPKRAKQAETAPAPVKRSAGPKRALVQLKIDAMFGAPGMRLKAPTERCAMKSGTCRTDEAHHGAGHLDKADRGMDLDDGSAVEVTPQGVQAAQGEEAACYVCRGGLEKEGGDVLCSFCDRAACQGCWQKCLTCEMPHCSLCLAADYSSQFECYFCPPCYQDKRLESGQS